MPYFTIRITFDSWLLVPFQASRRHPTNYFQLLFSWIFHRFQIIWSTVDCHFRFHIYLSRCYRSTYEPKIPIKWYRRHCVLWCLHSAVIWLTPLPMLPSGNCRLPLHWACVCVCVGCAFGRMGVFGAEVVSVWKSWPTCMRWSRIERCWVWLDAMVWQSLTTTNRTDPNERSAMRRQQKQEKKKEAKMK